MKIISSLSNSQAGIIDTVQIEYRKHWFRGLRQAELLTTEGQLVVVKNSIANNKNLRQVEIAKKYLRIWRLLAQLTGWIPLFGCIVQDKAIGLAEDIQVAKLEEEKFQILLRNSRMELDVAEKQKAQILQSHPEAEYLEFEELQERYSHDALIAQKKACIRPELLSMLYGLPRTVGSLIFESSPEDQKLLLQEIDNIRQNHCNDRSSRLSDLIHRLPPDRQEVYIGLLSSEQEVTYNA